MKVLFAGSFNPPTLGHTELIRRAARMFDRVTVAIMINAEKRYPVSSECRAELLKKCFAELDNVDICIDTGLTAVLARNLGADALIRGVRSCADFEYELGIADANRTAYGIETIFIPAAPQFSFISSSIVRDIAAHDGDISRLVPAEILDDIKDIYSKER